MTAKGQTCTAPSSSPATTTLKTTETSWKLVRRFRNSSTSPGLGLSCSVPPAASNLALVTGWIPPKSSIDTRINSGMDVQSKASGVFGKVLYPASARRLAGRFSIMGVKASDSHEAAPSYLRAVLFVEQRGGARSLRAEGPPAEPPNSQSAISSSIGYCRKFRHGLYMCRISRHEVLDDCFDRDN